MTTETQSDIQSVGYKKALFGGVVSFLLQQCKTEDEKRETAEYFRSLDFDPDRIEKILGISIPVPRKLDVQTGNLLDYRWRLECHLGQPYEYCIELCFYPRDRKLYLYLLVISNIYNAGPRTTLEQVWGKVSTINYNEGFQSVEIFFIPEDGRLIPADSKGSYPSMLRMRGKPFSNFGSLELQTGVVRFKLNH